MLILGSDLILHQQGPAAKVLAEIKMSTSLDPVHTHSDTHTPSVYAPAAWAVVLISCQFAAVRILSGFPLPAWVQWSHTSLRNNILITFRATWRIHVVLITQRPRATGQACDSPSGAGGWWLPQLPGDDGYMGYGSSVARCLSMSRAPRKPHCQ